MAKIKVDKHDYLRVILTETLPYEVPITFLNEGLYFYLKKFPSGHSHPETVNDKDAHTFIRSFLYYSDYTKPYNYRINKNSNSKRLLSVPHPSIQRQISDFYKNYDSVITGLCSKSPVSLRSPAHVASRYYEKELANYEKSTDEKNVETEGEGFENTSVYASSYFTYRKYNFLYKFYDSYESHRIEKKFEHLTRFDISKCFHNIYIPTLSWAVKSQDFSKKYSSHYSFEGNFQELMKNTNNLDTSGIIVGPEISRIYAEIILQDLDLKIIERLKIEYNLHFDTDYTLRRYVDDYFLYTKKPESSINALPIIKNELEKYKLFINESKTEYLEVPFITGLTIAKMDCKDLISNVFANFLTTHSTDSVLVFPGSPARESNRLIRSIKRIVKDNEVKYESLSGYLLAEIRRRLFKIIDDDRTIVTIENKKSEQLQKLILFCIEVSFFVYSMDIRVRTTYIITQLIVKLNGIITLGSIEFKDEISKKIYDESRLLLSKMQDKGRSNSIETLNLLIGLRTNLSNYPIKDETLLSLFNLKSDASGNFSVINPCEEIAYFQIMVLSSFIRTDKPQLCLFLQQLVIEHIDKQENIVMDTASTCMIFDSISNPYFSDDFKRLLIMKVSKILGIKIDENKTLEFISKQEWFFTWDENNLAQVLMKKELRSPY